MTAVDRAAEIIHADFGFSDPLFHRRAVRIANALAAADPPLLMTDEIQAVLDAGATRAEAAGALDAHNQAPDRSKHLTLQWTDLMAEYDEADQALIAAVDAYIASRGGTP